MRVYLDNAATTPIHPEVADYMCFLLKEKFGNPSSIHAYGREVRTIVEQARKTIAGLLSVSPAEIFFTSGGTEANNTAISCSVRDYGIKQAITSSIEHHAVLHTLEDQAASGKIKLHKLEPDESGNLDLDQLEELVLNCCKQSGETPVLVSLMHANNEIGNLLPLKRVGEMLSAHHVIFHSDTVQTMAHFKMDLSSVNVHFASCAAHKFHGPKGSGFLYKKPGTRIKPFVYGGSQERNFRGGTENVYGIAGMAKAFELAHQTMEADQKKVKALKSYMAGSLKEKIPGILFNGDMENGLYTVLNVSFPPGPVSEMLLFKLDIEGIAASGGSACSSGSEIGSHVLTALKADPNRPAVRFSFSANSTKEEVDFAIGKLEAMFPVHANEGN